MFHLASDSALFCICDSLSDHKKSQSNYSTVSHSVGSCAVRSAAYSRVWTHFLQVLYHNVDTDAEYEKLPYVLEHRRQCLED